MKTLLFMSSLLAAIMVGHAQEKEEKGTIKASTFSSQFLISTDLKAVYFNFVGPGLKYSKGDFSFSLGVFPTLRFYDDPHKDPEIARRPFICPGFSAGPMLQFKKVMVGFPTFYAPNNNWYFTAGLGLKIGAPNVRQ